MLRAGSVLGVLVLLAIAKVVVSNQCLTMLEEVNPKRIVQQEGQMLDISFEVSDRVTQRLATIIMKIFLTEVLGYKGVSIFEVEDDFRPADTFRRLSYDVSRDTGQRINPMSMVNLEVWIPPHLDTMPLLNYVKECGSIAPPGHFGWFVPSSLSMLGDSWITFLNPETASRFDVDQTTLQRIKDFTMGLPNGTHYCSESYCREGMYVPENCRGQPCALLLTSYPDVTYYVKDHIDQLKLYVKVAWVGPHLQYLTETLTKEYSQLTRNSTFVDRSLVILHWSPSSVVPNERDFTTIEFPRCGSKYTEAGCRYEPNRLTKLVWADLEHIAKLAFEAINRARFTSDMYEDLINRYNKYSKNVDEEEIACDWLKDNLNYTLTKWMPNNADKNILYVGGIFPMSETFYSGKSIFIAAGLAKEAINMNNTVLRDYNLTLLANDGQCKSDMVMRSFIDLIIQNYPKLIGVLGPACSETVEPLVSISKHYKTVIISYSAEGASFNDRKKYPYFFRTIGENKQYKHVYLQLLKRLGWKRVASLTEDGQKYTEYISYMQDMLRDNGIVFVANAKFPREREADVMTKYLQDLKQKKAKIIIADVYDQVARQVMCEAYRLEMTAFQGYVWFLPLWLRPEWYDTDRYNKNGEEVPCTTAEMSKAINGHLGLSHAYFAPDDHIMQEGITVRQWRDRYELLCRKKHQPPSNYAGFAYDAMWTYAYAMNQLLRENQSYVFDLHSPQTINRLTDIIGATDFYGVSGRIKFFGGPSRYTVINIIQFVNNETRLVGNFYPNVSETKHEVVGGKLNLNVSAIVWLSNKMPDDGTEPPQRCVISGFADFLNVSCEVAFIIVNILGCSLLGAVVIIAVIIMKRRYERKFRLHEKYFKSLGLDGKHTDASDLEKWEIPRDRVVINRKLGEGAFGTVYGGETFFPEKGWLAVAVKTLKVGSSTDEKLDFLSEVEVMKRFEHKNIIKLLGVCIKGQPVLTVMEFMLYGDLKTYLLARRNLVNDHNYENSEEISNKKLTAMALDVARALSYLAQMRYVHRDIASRNCLVNAQRVVKLGDFGMTRPMYENDYYKFNRKGMLPVRWMAPESLALGIFSPASDVWSYGVLLYEIITFGSFPFQGMSNNEVLIHVKNGNSLVVPKGVKMQLENLMYSCWSADKDKRPTAPDIVDFLAKNPQILAPCLDAPLASVQLEHTGQLEMQLSENFRKFSLSWPSQTATSRSTTSPSSPQGAPSPPLFDINSRDDNMNHGSLFSDVTFDQDCSEPLLTNSAGSYTGNAVLLQNSRRNDDHTPRYVNVQPGMSNNSENSGKDRQNAGDIQLKERNAMLPQQRNSEDVSIL